MVVPRGNTHSSARLCAARETLLSDGRHRCSRQNWLSLAGGRVERTSPFKTGHRCRGVHRVPHWYGKSNPVCAAADQAEKPELNAWLSAGPSARFGVKGGLRQPRATGKGWAASFFLDQ